MTQRRTLLAYPGRFCSSWGNAWSGPQNPAKQTIGIPKEIAFQGKPGVAGVWCRGTVVETMGIVLLVEAGAERPPALKIKLRQGRCRELSLRPGHLQTDTVLNALPPTMRGNRCSLNEQYSARCSAGGAATGFSAKLISKTQLRGLWFDYWRRRVLFHYSGHGEIAGSIIHCARLLNNVNGGVGRSLGASAVYRLPKWWIIGAGTVGEFAARAVPALGRHGEGIWIIQPPSWCCMQPALAAAVYFWVSPCLKHLKTADGHWRYLEPQVGRQYTPRIVTEEMVNSVPETKVWPLLMLA